MKPEIHIGSNVEVDRLLERMPGRITVISMRGSRDEGLKQKSLAKRATEIIVDDIEAPLAGYVHPERAHADALLHAWETAKAERERAILLNCHAGIARSPAAALGLLFLEAHAADPATAVTAAVAELLKTRPICKPNKLFLSEIVQLLIPPAASQTYTQQLLAAVEASQRKTESGLIF